MTHGIVTAAQPEATEAGALALKRGGNAVDAAIACALVQTVVDPQMCGIAGFGSMQVYMAERSVHTCIDFHGRAPSAARPDMWEHLIERETRDGFGFILKGRVNEVGYQSITTPGSLRAFDEALSRFGTMSLHDPLRPAIGYAEDGFRIRPHVHAQWTQPEDLGRASKIDRLRHTQSGRRIYFDDKGDLLRLGATLRNPDMGRTLRRIARNGASDFYEGEIAREIAADMERHGGLLTLKDLRDYRAQENEPLWGEYRGRRISTNQPPGGGIMVLQMLNILENFDLQALGHNSPEYIRVVSEAMKRATVDKDAYVGDPMFVEVPVRHLLDKGYARECAEAIRRGEKVRVARFGAEEPRDTTQVCVLDEHGNAVTMTHSLGSPSGVITDGLGFMYNGCMGVFDPRPGRAGSLAPGKSRFSSMAPSIVFEGDEPMLVIGAPGGTYIAMGILQVMLNVLDFGMPILDAVHAARFCATSDVIDVVNRIPRYVTQDLEAMGYTIARSHLSYHFAGVHAILIEDGRRTGAADPGRDGMALTV